MKNNKNLFKWGYIELENKQNNPLACETPGKKPLPFFDKSDYHLTTELVYGEYYNNCIEYFFTFNNDTGWLKYYRTIKDFT